MSGGTNRILGNLVDCYSKCTEYREKPDVIQRKRESLVEGDMTRKRDNTFHCVGYIPFAYTAWKVSKYGVLPGPYFPAFLSVFCPNARKYGPGKTPHLDTFHAVLAYWQGLRLF